jgi:hypothetical protein
MACDCNVVLNGAPRIVLLACEFPFTLTARTFARFVAANFEPGNVDVTDSATKARQQSELIVVDLNPLAAAIDPICSPQ